MAACAALLVLPADPSRPQEDLFEFFAEEAQVSSAALRPHSLSQAPATAYVLEGDDLRRSGAQTLWDLLRSVPGVDVMTMRTSSGAVSIRGLNKAATSRTLLLVDGRTVLDGYLDNVNWESLPVLLEEIERIEIVEGPASALYGGNAINGAINIITRTPAQVHGGEASYTVGEHATHLGSLLYGRQQDRVGYRLGLGWRSGNRFGDAAQRAAATAKGNALLSFRLSETSSLRVSAGGTWLDTDLSLGGLLGQVREKGRRGFVRLDLEGPDTRVRLFRNNGRTRWEEFVIPLEPDLEYETYDAQVERQVVGGLRHGLVVGAGFRRNSIASDPVAAVHHLWALFGEDEWRVTRRWSLWSSLRLDRHPHAGTVLSPRFSAVYAPVPRQSVRLSVGTSFRNPTLAENHLRFSEVVALPSPLPDLNLDLRGSTRLDPEQLLFAELAHTWQGRWVRTAAAVFRYRLEDVVNPILPEAIPADTGVVALGSSFVNGGRADSWGGEFGVEAAVRPQVRCFANYALQHRSREQDSQTAIGGKPHHKLNAGLHARRGRVVASAAARWVGATAWSDNAVLRTRSSAVTVDGYFLVDAYLGYLVTAGDLALEAAFVASNLLDNRHYETLAGMDLLAPGQSGEAIGARRSARLTCRF